MTVTDATPMAHTPTHHDTEVDDCATEAHYAATLAAADMALTMSIDAAGDTLAAHQNAARYLDAWITDRHGAAQAGTVDDLLSCMANLRYLERGGDPLNMVDDGWRAGADEAKDYLERQNLTDLSHALSSIVWAS